jgi:hypothetical protein
VCKFIQDDRHVPFPPKEGPPSTIDDRRQESSSSPPPCKRQKTAPTKKAPPPFSCDKVAEPIPQHLAEKSFMSFGPLNYEQFLLLPDPKKPPVPHRKGATPNPARAPPVPPPLTIPEGLIADDFVVRHPNFPHESLRRSNKYGMFALEVTHIFYHAKYCKMNHNPP